MYIEVQNKYREKVALLENAKEIKEEIKANAISNFSFTLPIDDPKNEFLRNPFTTYIKAPHGLYRILPNTMDFGNLGTIKYECEHVIATLIDDIIFGNIIYGNIGIYTPQVINFILNRQKTKNWVLDKCEFSRQFEYAWENETLASALFSIPKPLENDYLWKFNTDTYPWKLSLIKLNKDGEPKFFIMPKKNQLNLKIVSEVRDLFTRIYPLGYGEGVNQLTIKDVNNGVPYLQASAEAVAKYGIIERPWIDRRYENPQSLKDAAQVMLDRLSEPARDYDVDFALFPDDVINIGDKVQVRTKSNRDEAHLYDDFITGLNFDYDNITTSKVTLSNKPYSVASTIAEIADRQRIEMSYSQGATQLYAQSIQVNADSRDGAEINFFIPSEMRIINKVIAKIKLESFRAYSKAIKGGGGSERSTEDGGGQRSSTASGGGQYQGGSTAAGGSVTQTTHDATNVHGYNIYPQVSVNGPGVTYYGSVSGGIYHVNSHEHVVYIRDHSHSFDINIRDHTHSYEIPRHSHSFRIPDHTHDIEYGIYRYYGSLNSFNLKVNNQLKKTYYSTNEEIDITEFLLDNKNKISRGTWHSLEAIPNDLAYISIDLILQGFVQSRGDYTV